MPKVIISHDALEKVVKELDLTAELFEEQAGKLKYGPDLEVIIRGRLMDNGKRIGPYARLLSYEPGEEIVRQGEWGGNIFYISATGSLDVYVADSNGSRRKIGELPSGTCFGEMSVLAGIERNATVAVPAGDAATVLELARPSLRLLRKLPKFGQALDSTYRSHGLNRVLEDLTRAIPAPTNQEIVNRLEQIGKFMVYGKPHLLCEEGKPADRIILIKSGWVRRIRGIAFNAAEKGIVDGVNLLVMDMDLCVRCGNCSLACHKVHGQSRLLRRGINIERPIGIGTKKTQHVLSPQVCMHCKDPECLTGCPTGAIFRGPGGDVDIEAATCIGCFDCATQCPYDAITMVPRQPAIVAKPDLFTRIKRLLSLASREPPPSEQQTDDMVAIKCNLCADTPLNPPGARRKAYSCEENCPTGALVRVNPVEYFSETGSTLGLILRDQTHGIGRNIHKSDPTAKLWHVGGIFAILLWTILVVSGLGRYGVDKSISGTWLTMRWLTGMVGLVGIAAVMTYPLRKQIYRRRAGALRYWLLAHLYIGAIAGIVLLLHAGPHTGGAITTSLYVAFDFVIASGLVGLGTYLIAPRILTSLEGEPLLLEDLVLRHNELRQALGKLVDESEGALKDEIKERVSKRFSSKRFLLRQFVPLKNLQTLLAESRQLFKDRTTRLATETERTRLLEAVETAVTLRRLDALIYLHTILKLWIAPHVISTSLMLMLMIVHVIQVIFFAVKR